MNNAITTNRQSLAGASPLSAARPSIPKAGHVLFACYDFSVGGHSTHTLNFGRALKQLGYKVGVIVPEPFGALARDFQNTLDYIEVVRRGAESRTGFVGRLTEKIIQLNPDVLINNAVPSVQAALPYLPPQVRRISVVHNYVKFEVALGLANSPWLDSVVSVSDNVSEMVRADNSEKVRLETIPVGIEVPERAREQTDAAMPLRLIYVGRLEAQKNIPGLLKVLSALQESGLDFNMTVVGGGAEFEPTRAAAASSSYSHRIKFMGMQTQKDVARLLDENDFLLMTSHYEGTPHALLEAMAHGLVSLVSNLPGATDRMITHGQDGFLCDRNSPAEYVGILKQFVAQPGKFAAVSKAARNTAINRYGATALAKKYEALFQPVAGKPRPIQKQLGGEIEIVPALQLNFPGRLLQIKHRVADSYRQWFKGRKPAL